MSESGTHIHVSPLSVVLLAVFTALTSPVLLSALLLSAVAHELGHYAAIRSLGGRVSHIRITVFGAEMTVDGRFSYGGDMLASLAGPAVNLLLSVLLSQLGRWGEIWYLFAGCQAVLGVFNLLPIQPLDGGRALWSLAAWCTEPYTADRIARCVGVALSALLSLAMAWLLLRRGGTVLLLLTPLGLLGRYGREIGLVKRLKKR